jgi:hypothetical protein
MVMLHCNQKSTGGVDILAKVFAGYSNHKGKLYKVGLNLYTPIYKSLEAAELYISAGRNIEKLLWYGVTYKF